jgi:hypothetical protein
MPFKLIYTATLAQTDNDFNPNGYSFSFAGSQVFGGSAPSSSDLTTMATAMGSDIGAQLSAKYPAQNNSDNSGTAGGQG